MIVRLIKETFFTLVLVLIASLYPYIIDIAMYQGGVDATEFVGYLVIAGIVGWVLAGWLLNKFDAKFTGGIPKGLRVLVYYIMVGHMAANAFTAYLYDFLYDKIFTIEAWQQFMQ